MTKFCDVDFKIQQIVNNKMKKKLINAAKTMKKLFREMFILFFVARCKLDRKEKENLQKCFIKLSREKKSS